MERVLESILKDSSANKHPLLRITCKETIDFLETQQGFLHASPSELREKCLEVLKLALETKNNKLVSHALAGFQKMLRDNSFNSAAFEKTTKESEEKLLPYQVLSAIMCLPELSDELQVEFLKLLISISCSNNWSLTNKTVLWTIQLCLDLYGVGSTQVRTATQATASQTLSSYSLFLQENLLLQHDAPESTNNSNDKLTESDLKLYFEKILPIFKELTKKLNKKNISKSTGKPTVIVLECLLALLSSVPASNINEIAEFTNYLWQDLFPSLIVLLGSPLSDKNIISAQSKIVEKVDGSSKELGRGSACLSSAPSLHGVQAKAVYSIVVELVRLIGVMQSLRPVLEALFHRILIYPPPHHRHEALKIFSEILKKPDSLLNLTQPLHVEDYKNTPDDELSLLWLLMEAAKQCCHCGEALISYTSIEIVVMLLNSLEELCLGKGISVELVKFINQVFPLLEDADYKPLPKQNSQSATKEFDDISIRGYDAQDEFSSDGSDKISIHKRYRKTLADLRQFTSSEEEDEEEADVHDVEVEVHDESDQSKADENEVIVPPIDECNQQDIGYNTDSSGVTEGPEEGFNDDYEEEIQENEEEEVEKREKEAARLDKVPKTLLGDDAGQTERKRIENLCKVRNEMVENERENAKHFVTTLQQNLPKLLSIKGSITVDIALQEFASSYCDGVWSKQNHKATDNNSDESLNNIIIMNADGVYLATYSTLLLNLKLMRNGCYSNEDRPIPVTEEQFIEEVHGSGVLVYLSAIWLSQVYSSILEENLLINAGYTPISMENCSLINLLTDIDGLGSSHQGDQLLSDYQRLEKAAVNIHKSPDVEAGLKIARRVLMASWDNILEILSILLNNKDNCGATTSISLMLGVDCAKVEQKRAQDAIALSLDGLQKAARLSNMLGLQSQCGAVFSQLAMASCLSDNSKSTMKNSRVVKYIKAAPSILSISKNRSLRLHSSYALSMDVILGRGLELSSHSPDGWKHVFKCCIYVAELEHKFYSKNQSAPTKVPPPVSKTKTEPTDDLTFSLNIHDFDEPVCEESFHNNFPIMPTAMMKPSMKIPDLVKEANLTGGSGMLNPDQVAKILFCLSQHIDRLYENAATKLNLSALLAFLSELCSASQAQLFSKINEKFVESGDHKENTLLLYRLGEVMLKCVRSGRPLIHIMKAWSIVAPHFVEAACNKDQTISKKAVTCIHDIVNALLSMQTELPHFHFNEALFKPFENLLTLELCDADIQDQIVSSICEFVEGCTTDIKSGWRPLFGALRSVHINAANPSNDGNIEIGHMRAVLDVFEAFLHTDNVFVFANAAVDCVLCLLKHVRGPTELQDNNEDSILMENRCLDLCIAALNYLYQFSAILSSMYEMPACPVFHSANRIKLNTKPQFVDPVIPNMRLVNFHEDDDKLSSIKEEENLTQTEYSKYCVTLESMDNHTSILHIWFLLLEGLAGAVATCPRKYQPHTMETLFILLKKILVVPGPDFAIYCINHLLLPMLQGWIRRTSRIYRGWDNFASNFKQCCGLSTDLVVEYIIELNSKGINHAGIPLMLRQLFFIMNECIAQPTESISRLGCACIRHAISSLSSVMTPELWTVTCFSLKQATNISLHSLRQLMVCFRSDSDNFYGDIGMVKVAVRRDCLRSESERLKQLAHQVFLMESQRHCSDNGQILDTLPVDDEDRSYIFLLHPPNIENTLNPEIFIIRVPFKNIVVGLLCHQLILQTIGTLLLQGTNYVVPTLASILSCQLSASNMKSEGDKSNVILDKIEESHVLMLMECLEISYKIACEFDSRPGLKFLIQKVADAQVAANLYKQAGAAWTIHAVVLFELSMKSKPFSLGDIKKKLNETKKVISYADSSQTNEKPFDPIIELHKHLNSFCDTYIDLILDKDGRLFNADRINDQPIFFLTAPQDDFTMIFKSGSTGSTNKSPLKAGSPTRQSSIDSESDAKSDASDSRGLADGSLSKDSKVYSVATEKTIQNLMTEYKKRKQQRAMPARDVGSAKFSESKETDLKSPSEPVPEEIENQRRNSITKDGEARMEVFTEMIMAILELLHQLMDQDFQATLPIVFQAVSSLMVYASEPQLRSSLVDWLVRVSIIYDFSPTDGSSDS